MKSDLDHLMAERNLDGCLVIGNASGNPVMNYLTGGAHLERALVFKRRGAPIVLVHGGMERTIAAATGLELIDRDQRYNQAAYLKRHSGNLLLAEVAYLKEVIEENRLAGRLGVYGMVDAGARSGRTQLASGSSERNRVGGRIWGFTLQSGTGNKGRS